MSYVSYIFFVSFFSINRMQSIQNLGLAVVAMLSGYLVDYKGYLLLEVFFIIWLCGELYN